MELDAKKNSLNIANIVRFAILSLSLSFLGYILLADAWGTSTIGVEIHSVLAFIAITCSGFVLVQYVVSRQQDQTIFHASFIYIAIINIIRAIRIFFDDSVLSEYGTPLMVAGDTYYLTTVAVLLLIGIILRRNRKIRNRSLMTISLVIAAILLHILNLVLVFPTFPSSSLEVSSIVLGFIATNIFALSGIISSKTPESSTHFKVSLLIVGFGLFGISWLPSVLSLYFQSNIWLMAFSLRTAGLIVLSMAIAVPFLSNAGMKQSYAYLLVFGLDSLVLLPAGVTVISERHFLLPILLNEELFLVVHAGAALVAIIMAFLIFNYDIQKPALKRRPIITLFITWGTIELYLVFASIIMGVDFIGGSIIPYLVGISFTIAHLPFAVRYTINPQILQKKTAKPNALRLIIISPLIFTILILGEIAGRIIGNSIADAYARPFGQSLLLLFAIFSIFGFVFYSSAQINDSNGKITVDVLSIGFLALWIIPSLIKANYLPWTVGWHSAEILLILGIIFGPAVLGLMYLRELEKSELSQKRATLFADLLVHDISNYHQAISLSLGLLELESLNPSAKLEALRDAYHELQRADLLVRNVRRLGMIDGLSKKKMERTDVVETIEDAFRIASRKASQKKIDFHVNQNVGVCFVLASGLLLDVFLNLFDNAIEYSSDHTRIDVEIEENMVDRREYWKIDVSDNGIGIEPERRHKLFSRYMIDSQGTGLGLSVVSALIQAFGGKISVRDRVPGEYDKGTTFSIILPKV